MIHKPYIFCIFACCKCKISTYAYMFIPTHATQPAPKRLRQFTQTVYIIAALACSLSACQPARTGGEAASWDADSTAVVDAAGLDSMLKMVHEAYVKNDLEEALDKAIRCNLIAKQRGMRVREAMSDFYYGICQTWLGQVPEGLKRMQEATGVIAGDEDSASICFLPFCYKELASAHIAADDLDAAIQDCMAREAATSKAASIGAGERFIDSQRGNNAILLATLYDFTGREAEGRKWLQQFKETAYAKTIEGAHGLLDYYNSTDQAEAYIETFGRAGAYFGADTMNLRYRDEVMYLINAYHSLDNMDGMVDAIRRVVALNDSVMNRTVRSNSLRLQEQYKVKTALKEVELGRERTRRNIRLALATGTVLLVIIGILLRFNLKMRRKNGILARQANRACELEEQLALRRRGRQREKLSLTDEELEGRLDEWLDADDHFLNRVTIQDAAAALNVTQKRITEALEARGTYKNLEEWATHKRVGRACKLILSRPEYTIESIAAEAGFSSPRTFYRKFQSETGLSPTEYRQAMSRDDLA